MDCGIPGWRSGLAPAFGPGRDPGDPESNPTSGSRCMEPASPSAYVSASLSLCDYHKINKKLKKKKKKMDCSYWYYIVLFCCECTYICRCVTYVCFAYQVPLQNVFLIVRCLTEFVVLAWE